MNGIVTHRAKTSGGFYREPRPFTEPHVAYPRVESQALEAIVKHAGLVIDYPDDPFYRSTLISHLQALNELRHA